MEGNEVKWITVDFIRCFAGVPTASYFPDLFRWDCSSPSVTVFEKALCDGGGAAAAAARREMVDQRLSKATVWFGSTSGSVCGDRDHRRREIRRKVGLNPGYWLAVTVKATRPVIAWQYPLWVRRNNEEFCSRKFRGGLCQQYVGAYFWGSPRSEEGVESCIKGRQMNLYFILWNLMAGMVDDYDFKHLSNRKTAFYFPSGIVIAFNRAQETLIVNVCRIQIFFAFTFCNRVNLRKYVLIIGLQSMQSGQFRHWHRLNF